MNDLTKKAEDASAFFEESGPIANLEDPSVLSFAYLGDSVMERLVRRRLIRKYKTSAECNAAALSFVTAGRQKEALKRVRERFTDQEESIFSRAKNAKAPHAPHNTDLYTYRVATGLEAVFGYLDYLGEYERVEELFAIAFPENE